MIRQLGTEEEDKWLDMVASCYAAKGTSRDVFKRHLERTPPNERALLAILDQGKCILNTTMHREIPFKTLRFYMYTVIVFFI